jgi:hypothetical protein
VGESGSTEDNRGPRIRGHEFNERWVDRGHRMGEVRDEREDGGRDPMW